MRPTVRERPAPDPDLVFDFTGQGPADLACLSLVLTARQMAEESDRRIWLRALPDRTWQVLQALGLDGWFEFFPAGGEPLD